MKKGIRHRDEDSRRRGRVEVGFSLVELMIVVVIVLITSAIALPQYTRMRHTSNLRGTASDFSGLIQTARIRAVQDGTFYSLYVSSTRAFVDVKNGNGAFISGDPLIPLTSEVTPIAATSAPATTNLYSQFLPAGSTIGPSANMAYDGTTTPITMSSRGIPCRTQTATGGTVCESGGGAIPFWIFFKNTISGEQEAVTVSPAGRIRKWYYGGGAWNAI